MKDKKKFNERQYVENMFDVCFELCSRVCRWSKAEQKSWSDEIAYNFKHGRIKDHDWVTKLRLANWFLLDHAVRHGFFLAGTQKPDMPSGWVV